MIRFRYSLEADALKRIQSAKPKMFSDVNATAVTSGSIGIKDYGQEYRYWRLSCSCGETKLQLLNYPQPRNLFTQLATLSKVYYLAPLWVNCTKCETPKLLFHPNVHGYDAEFGQASDIHGEGEESVFNTTPKEVYVGLSYKWLSGYTTESENQIANVEDYFDHICVFMQHGRKIKSVFDWRCGLG